VVVDSDAENKRSTDQLLKPYNIWKINVTPDHAAANGVIEPGPRPIADAPSKHTAGSDEPTEMGIDHLSSVLLADMITARHTTRYSPFHLIFGQDAVFLTELENLRWNTTNWIQEINDAAPLIAARARQLEP